MTHDAGAPAAARGIRAACCALAVGLGLARYAYAPLVPALIDAGRLTPRTAAVLGAANFAGNVAGALAAPWLARRGPPATVLRALLLLVTATFAACALPLGVAWLALWRGVAGASGAALLVLAAPAVLPRVAPHRRGRAAGVVFAGAGLGVVAAGTLTPTLLRAGPAAAWAGIGLACALLTACAWHGWPAAWADAAPPARPAEARGGRAFVLVYALAVLGLVPHAVFFVDYVARALGQGLAVGGALWAAFGVAAAAGPVLAGRWTDRVGARGAWHGLLALQCLGLACAPLGAALPAPAGRLLGLLLSALLVGACTLGIGPAALGRARDLAGGDAVRATATWSRATTASAVSQAAGVYGVAGLFARGASHDVLFWLAAASTLGALLLARRLPSP